MKIDVKYNYLIGDSYDKFPTDFALNTRIDPDTGINITDDSQRERTSKKLYDDLITCYCGQMQNFEVESKLQEFKPKPPFYTLFINDDEFLLSSDYIGPSVYWADALGVENSKILEFLKIARTIGGHMVWPRGFGPNKLTINTARSGDKGFYDRIDWTLQAIKIYYDFRSKDEFIEECKKLLPEDYCEFGRFENFYSALQNSKKWLSKFGSFCSFCDFFKLKDSFVDEQRNVIYFAPLFPILPTNYKDYIDKCVEAIVKKIQS
jgi:hypothetical protein